MAKAKRTTRASDPAEHVVDCALTLAVERGWRRVSLADIAAAAKLSLAELYGLYRSKEAILSAFLRRIDKAALAEGSAEGDTPRDRLFDALMRRFEALRPHKAAVEAILRDSRDPLALLCGAPRLLRSMAWALEVAGLGSQGLIGRARAKGLAVVYLSTLRVWLSDDTSDMSRTMAALDKGLRRAETLAGLCRPLESWRGRHGAGTEAA
jgi:AcrR family transcriptional regulator